jgi:hypothetical protein
MIIWSFTSQYDYAVFRRERIRHWCDELYHSTGVNSFAVILFTFSKTRSSI